MQNTLRDRTEYVKNQNNEIFHDNVCLANTQVFFW